MLSSLRQRFEEAMRLFSWFPIRLRFFKLFGHGSHCWFGAATDVTFDGEPILIDEVGINFNLSLIRSRRHNFRDYMARHLTSLGIPKYAQPEPDILRTIVEAVDVTLPGVPISVIVVDVSLCLFGEAAMPLAGIMADLLGSVSTN